VFMPIRFGNASPAMTMESLAVPGVDVNARKGKERAPE